MIVLVHFLYFSIKGSSIHTWISEDKPTGGVLVCQKDVTTEGCAQRFLCILKRTLHVPVSGSGNAFVQTLRRNGYSEPDRASEKVCRLWTGPVETCS